MRKLLNWMNIKKTKKRRVFSGGENWMRDQLARMGKMNQGIISMSLGKD